MLSNFDLGLLDSPNPGGDGKCTTCGSWVGLLNKHARGVLIRSSRVFFVHEQPFCSAECRETWWRASGEDLAKIDTPATLEWQFCACTGREGIAGIGTLIPSIQGRQVVLATQDGKIVRRHNVAKTAGCKACTGLGCRSPAPAFFYAEPGDIGWSGAWNLLLQKDNPAGFDRDLRVSVYDLNFADTLWIKEREVVHTANGVEFRETGIAHMNMDAVSEQHLFDNPKQMMAWWRASISDSDQAIVRKRYELARELALT